VKRKPVPSAHNLSLSRSLVLRASIPIHRGCLW
jgi:hypothetical protein